MLRTMSRKGLKSIGRLLSNYVHKQASQLPEDLRICGLASDYRLNPDQLAAICSTDVEEYKLELLAQGPAAVASWLESIFETLGINKYKYEDITLCRPGITNFDGSLFKTNKNKQKELYSLFQMIDSGLNIYYLILLR